MNDNILKFQKLPLFKVKKMTFSIKKKFPVW